MVWCVVSIVCWYFISLHGEIESCTCYVRCACRWIPVHFRGRRKRDGLVCRRRGEMEWRMQRKKGKVTVNGCCISSNIGRVLGGLFLSLS